MGSDQDHTHANGPEVRAYPGEDAGDGQAFIYGKRPGNVEDLGVSHWKYANLADGEYSLHERTKLFEMNGNIVTPSEAPFDGNRRYSVDRGSTYDIEFTYENNGFNQQTGIKLGFYVSTNNLITTADRLVTTRTLGSMVVDKVFTDRTAITIPNDLGGGQTYWLGVIIDPDDSVPETDPYNGTFMPILIK